MPLCEVCSYDLISGWCSNCDLADFVQDRDREDGGEVNREQHDSQPAMLGMYGYSPTYA